MHLKHIIFNLDKEMCWLPSTRCSFTAISEDIADLDPWFSISLLIIFWLVTLPEQLIQPPIYLHIWLGTRSFRTSPEFGNFSPLKYGPLRRRRGVIVHINSMSVNLYLDYIYNQLIVFPFNIVILLLLIKIKILIDWLFHV